MAFKLHGRVRETTLTEGTGTYALDGAVSGFKSISEAGYATSDTGFFLVTNGVDWEEIRGTVGSGTVARTEIIDSSNDGDPVDWGAGLKEIMVALPGPSDLTTQNLALLQQALGITSGGVGHAGLKVDVTSTSQVSIAGRMLSLDNSGGDVRWLRNISLTASMGSTGVNGRDGGSEASSTWYHVYVIYNPDTDTVASLLSTSATSPTLPSGYTFKRRVGAVRNNTSSNLITTIQRGARTQYVGSAAPALPMATMENVSIAAFVPATAIDVTVALFAEVEGTHESAGPNSNMIFGLSLSGYKVMATFLIETASTAFLLSFGAGTFVGWEDDI